MEESVKANGTVDPRLLLKGNSGNYLLCLLLLGLVIRLVPAYYIYGSNDVGAWRWAIRELSHGANPYLTKKLNWPPLWPTILLYTARMEQVYHLPDAFSVKVVPCLMDTLIGVSLYVWFALHNIDYRAAFRRALWYTLNPVAIFTCAFHGQFDCMPAFFSLLAVMALLRPPTWQATLKSAFWLNLGIMARTWPGVLLPIMLIYVRGLRQKVVYALLALVPSAICVYLLYRQAPAVIMESVILYRGSSGGWGLTAPAVFMSKSAGLALGRLVLGILYLAWGTLYLIVWRTRMPLPQAACLGVLTYFVFAPGCGLQHLAWIVPIGLFADAPRARLYSLVASLSIAIQYIWSPFNGEHFGFLKRTRSDLFWATNTFHHHQVMLMWTMLPLWIFCVWWYIRLLRDSLVAARLAVTPMSVQ
jgi:hypothetical protein